MGVSLEVASEELLLLAETPAVLFDLRDANESQLTVVYWDQIDSSGSITQQLIDKISRSIGLSWNAFGPPGGPGSDR